MGKRLGRGVVGAVVAVAVMGAVLLPAGAVSVNSNERRTSFSICTEDAPAGQDPEDVEDAIEAIDNEWEAIPEVASSVSAIHIVVRSDCNTSHDVEVVFEVIEKGCCATYTGSKIRFHTGLDSQNNPVLWCLDPGQPCNTSVERSFRGVLLHEMGHALGAGHSGTCLWNYGKPNCHVDGADNFTTMLAAPTIPQSYKQASLEKDDKSLVPWMETGGLQKWWSRDPGFEAGHLGAWYTKGNVSITTDHERTGDYAVLLTPQANGNMSWMRIHTVYDPWNTGGDHKPDAAVYSGMTSTPRPDISTWYRENGNKGGGVRLHYRYRYLDYDTTVAKQAPDTPTALLGPWQISITPLATCNYSNSAWAPDPCVASIPTAITLQADREFNDRANNALLLRARFTSQTENALRLDETGVQDW